MLTDVVRLFDTLIVLPQSLYDDEELWNRIYFDESVGCQTARDEAWDNILVDAEDHDLGLYYLNGSMIVPAKSEPRYWCVGNAGCNRTRLLRELNHSLPQCGAGGTQVRGNPKLRGQQPDRPLQLQYHVPAGRRLAVLCR